jgi:hypothetical protein
MYLSLGLHKERPSYRRSLQLSKEAIQHLKTWTLKKIYTFVGHICPLGSGSGSNSGSATLVYFDNNLYWPFTKVLPKVLNPQAKGPKKDIIKLLSNMCTVHWGSLTKYIYIHYSVGRLFCFIGKCEWDAEKDHKCRYGVRAVDCIPPREFEESAPLLWLAESGDLLWLAESGNSTREDGYCA